MAHRVAFLRRDDGWLVCATCANFHRETDGPYCMDDRIRYNPAVYGCSMYGSGDNEDLLTRTVGLFKVTKTADTIRATWTWDDGQDRVETALYRITELYCTREPEEDFDRMVLVGSPVDMDGAPEMEWSIPIQDTERRLTIVTSASKPHQSTLEAFE